MARPLSARAKRKAAEKKAARNVATPKVDDKGNKVNVGKPTTKAKVTRNLKQGSTRGRLNKGKVTITDTTPKPKPTVAKPRSVPKRAGKDSKGSTMGPSESSKSGAGRGSDLTRARPRRRTQGRALARYGRSR